MNRKWKSEWHMLAKEKRGEGEADIELEERPVPAPSGKSEW